MANFEFNEIGKIGKSISVQEMKGNDTTYLRINKLYKDDEGIWHPTKNGVSIPKTGIYDLIQMIKLFMDKNGMEVPESIKTDLEELTTAITSDITELE